MKEEKERLRESMRAVRAAIPAPDRARLAGAAENHLFALPQVAEAGTVLLFYAFGSEIRTAGIAERLAREGKRLLLPFLGADGMGAAEVLPGESLIASSYGPKEPPRRVAVDPSTVDVVVTPGLAFDADGRRLGYGGGHYDRYLARLTPDALRVGIGFSIQLVERIPEEPDDQRVHLVVTDAGVVDCRPPL